MKPLLAVAVAALALPAGAYAWGGSYPTGDTLGTSVTIDVSDSYPVDQTLPQTWATFLGTLVHGPELSKLTLHLLSMSEVSAKCGAQALACYDPGSETIYATPDDQLDEPPAREVVMHEYGHHIANNRSDAPWSAEDWGTKRWASYENICRKAATGTAAPGNEGQLYNLNPGEAFAEAYRVLNLTDAGSSTISWDVVDRSFYPDATALQLLQEDIASPWTANTVRSLHGSFGGGSVRTFPVSTPLDGTFTARLTKPTRAHMQLALYSGPKLVARGQSVRYQICGARTLTLKVQRASGAGAFSVALSKP